MPEVPSGIGPRGTAFLLGLAEGLCEAEALQRSCLDANYWERPHQVTNVPQSERDRLASLLNSDWWARAFLQEQFLVSFSGQKATSSDIASALSDWKSDAQQYVGWDKRRRVSQRARGPWWSTPEIAAPSTTTGAYGLPAMGLAFNEDDPGGAVALVSPLRASASLRVKEIGSQSDWSSFVAEYPLDVTGSRGATWYDYMGIESQCFIPDYVKASSNYDVVHLTGAGYVRAAGVPLNVAGGVTMIAGWGPDVSFWLTDTFTVERGEYWERTDDESLDWRRR